MIEIIQIQARSWAQNRTFDFNTPAKAREGDIKVFNDRVTYQLVYEINAIFSILIDRAGNYISTSVEN